MFMVDTAAFKPKLFMGCVHDMEATQCVSGEHRGDPL